ncbi:MAG: hypothetical protein AB1420_03120 [Bacillota bacterium]
MGKNISGVGIDPNITGRFLIRGQRDIEDISIYRIVCLDLTDESHHNALGVGMADVITKRLFDRIDLEITYANVITSGFLERGFIPIIQPNDKQAILTALSCCNRKLTFANARVAFIKNSLEINELLLSEALLVEVQDMPHIKILGEEPIPFDQEGNMLLQW